MRHAHGLLHRKMANGGAECKEGMTDVRLYIKPAREPPGRNARHTDCVETGKGGSNSSAPEAPGPVFYPALGWAPFHASSSRTESIAV